jgi:hypothetical protein
MGSCCMGEVLGWRGVGAAGGCCGWVLRVGAAGGFYIQLRQDTGIGEAKPAVTLGWLVSRDALFDRRSHSPQIRPHSGQDTPRPT